MPGIRCWSSSTTSTSSSAPIGSLTWGPKPVTKAATLSRRERRRTSRRAREVKQPDSCAKFWQAQETLCLQAHPLMMFPKAALSLMENLHDFDAVQCDPKPTPKPSQEGNCQNAADRLLPSREGSGVGWFLESLLDFCAVH